MSDNEETNEEYKKVPPQPASKWPSDVRSISLAEITKLGVDKVGNIYWDGKPIEIKRISLSFWQSTAAIVVVIAAAIPAVNTLWQWACIFGWLSKCPIS